MYLFFDTETTGFLNKNLPLNAPGQARCVQLGAMLTDAKGRVMQELNAVLYPDGWEVPMKAAEIHGFSTDICHMVGIPAKYVFPLFEQMLERAHTVVAHNLAFDNGIMTVEEAFGNLKWPSKIGFCTMLASTDVCCLPGRFGKYKWPTLIEAYRYFFKEDFQGAHDAMADVRACKRIYFEMLRLSINLNDLKT